MATKDIWDTEPRALFEVTCVIGTVFDSMSGQFTPREAAFNLIATHNAEGTFSFPNENGSICHVTVVTEPFDDGLPR